MSVTTQHPLLKTKPSWFPTAIATDRGWENPKTGEVLIAIGRLKTILGDVAPSQEKVNVTPTKEKKVKEPKVPKDKKVIAEVVEQPKDVQVIGEVVEDIAGIADKDVQVIGE